MRSVTIVVLLAVLCGVVLARTVHHQRQQALQAAAEGADTNAAADADTTTDAEARLQALIDAKFDVWGGGVKDKLHEAITAAALKLVTTADRASAAFFAGGNLENGVRWNDMPTGNVNDYLALQLFMYDFKVPGPTVVHQSHYGCLQHMHAMAPVFTPRAGLTQPVRFTNRDVLNFITHHAEHWWGRAVSAGLTTPRTKLSIATASHYLGHMSHMLQDSYAPGHAVRGYLQEWGRDPHFKAEPAPAHNAGDYDSAGLAAQCGHVLHFQGYGSQEGNEEHGNADHDPADVIKGRGRTDKPVRTRLIQCARSATRDLFTRFAACMKAGAASNVACAWATVKTGVFDPHFVLALPNELAGGSLTAMAGKSVVAAVNANRNGGSWQSVVTRFVDVIGAMQFGAKNAIIVPRFNPATDLLWSAGNPLFAGAHTMAAGHGICDSFTARTGLLAGTKLRFLDFPNIDSAGTDVDAPARAARGAVKYQI